MSEAAARSILAPNGILRAGINMSNGLLVTGKTASGDPVGVSPDMALEVAKRLGVELKLIGFPSPGELGDKANDDVWDIGNIGAEPSRAKTIDFTAAYAEIEATYLVPAGSPIQKIEDVDKKGVRIAISERSAYDLYLSRTLKNAELKRVRGAKQVFDLFVNEKLEALAGLRPGLSEEVKKVPGARILDGQFTAVQQAIGVAKGKDAAFKFLKDFVEECKANGTVARLIEKHGVTGKLMVAGKA